jgi:NAD(P)-dependent dehydrogenase (short-subunit alcohol dehydrogenase family)
MTRVTARVTSIDILRPSTMEATSGLLVNKVAIVTGASSGIGRAAALLFSAEGAAVVLNRRKTAALGHVFDSIRALAGTADAVPGDVGLPETT